jgi:alkylation response protein AidB-like acyl-CoA dehydrogenase
VDFELSEDQRAWQSAARELLASHASPERVRAVVDGGGALDAALWEAMVDQGWLGVERAEAAGGLAATAIEVAVLAEVVGEHVAPAPFVPTILAIAAYERGGERDTAAELAAGAVGCVAWSADPSAVTATRAGSGWRLDGRADPSPYAPLADHAAVLATTPGGPGVFGVALTDRERPAREPAMDLTRPLGWLRFDATPAVELGDESSATELCDRGATFAGAEMLGSAARALDLAVDYAKDRVQFGRPIGSFQAVKHRCADMLVDVEGMRSSVYWAAWCLAARAADASIAASSAKVWCSDASRRVMASALQVHGGIGFTWEHDLHLYLKRAQLDQLLFGDATHHRARLARLLRPRVEAGESVV